MDPSPISLQSDSSIDLQQVNIKIVTQFFIQEPLHSWPYGELQHVQPEDKFGHCLEFGESKNIG